MTAQIQKTANRAVSWNSLRRTLVLKNPQCLLAAMTHQAAAAARVAQKAAAKTAAAAAAQVKPTVTDAAHLITLLGIKDSPCLHIILMGWHAMPVS